MIHFYVLLNLTVITYAEVLLGKKYQQSLCNFLLVKAKKD